MLILIVAEGPDKGRIYEWHDDQTVIVGRESKDLRLSDGKASRQHARFKCEGGKWYVRDLASRHGTLVNNIRTTGKHPLADGDRVRIGRTELVVARMPAEQAERTALLGDLPSSHDVWHGLPTWRRFVPRATTAAAAVAAAFAVGCSAWLYLNTTDANQLLREDLLAQQQKVSQAQMQAVDLQTQAARTQLAMADNTDRILNEVQALGSNNTPVLREILASVRSQDGNGQLLSDIHTALAQMHDSSMISLDAILAGVQSQSAQLATLNEVRDMMSDQQARTAELMPQLRAVAVSTRANEAALAELNKQITQAQARPDMDAKVLDQLEALAAELRTRPNMDQVVEEIRTALTLEQKQTNELLSRIEKGLAASPETQALVAPLRQTLDRQAKATQDMLAKAFARQDQTEAQLEQIKALVAAQPGETAGALRGVLSELEPQTNLDEVLNAVKQLQDGSIDQAALARLEELTHRLEAVPTSEQLADVVVQAVSAQLNETQPILEQIAGSLDAAARRADNTRDLVDQLQMALMAQEAADTRLDQIYDLLASSGAAEDSDALDQVLREIRSKSIAGMDELRSTIRREIQAGLTNQRLATAREFGSLPGPAPEPAEAESVTPDQPIKGFALASPQGQSRAAVSDVSTTDGLTDVEHAYRLAFTTGKPITLGGGSIDPKTGKASPGRTLDPASAKAAGITDWRDWYLMDDFAERMRLQQQAINFHDKNRTGFKVLGIPADAKGQSRLD